MAESRRKSSGDFCGDSTVQDWSKTAQKHRNGRRRNTAASMTLRLAEYLRTRGSWVQNPAGRARLDKGLQRCRPFSFLAVTKTCHRRTRLDPRQLHNPAELKTCESDSRAFRGSAPGLSCHVSLWHDEDTEAELLEPHFPFPPQVRDPSSRTPFCRSNSAGAGGMRRHIRLATRSYVVDLFESAGNEASRSKLPACLFALCPLLRP